MGEQLVEVQQNLDKEKFYKEYVDLLTRPTPRAHPTGEARDQEHCAQAVFVALACTLLIPDNRKFTGVSFSAW